MTGWAKKLKTVHGSLAQDVYYVAKLWRKDIYSAWLSLDDCDITSVTVYDGVWFRGRLWPPKFLAQHLRDEIERGEVFKSEWEIRTS